MKRCKRRRWAWLIVLTALLLFGAGGLYDGLETMEYVITTDKLSAPVRLALITDLHSCDYGGAGEKLEAAVAAIQPDVVLLAGDIIDDGLPWSSGLDTVQGLTREYTCYYVSGNHEFWTWEIENVKKELRALGVIILEGETIELERNGQRIAISGIDDAWIGESENALQLERAAMARPGDCFSILLAHRPELIEQYLPYEYDLICSGHAHGGQVRLPFVLPQGLYAPNQGFFPAYTSGRFAFDETTLLVSRGLARESTRVPRFYNRRQLVSIVLEPS